MELPRLHSLQRDNEVMMQKMSVMMGVPLPTVVDTITRQRLPNHQETAKRMIVKGIIVTVYHIMASQGCHKGNIRP